MRNPSAHLWLRNGSQPLMLAGSIGLCLHQVCVLHQGWQQEGQAPLPGGQIGQQLLDALTVRLRGLGQESAAAAMRSGDTDGGSSS